MKLPLPLALDVSLGLQGAERELETDILRSSASAPAHTTPGDLLITTDNTALHDSPRAQHVGETSSEGGENRGGSSRLGRPLLGRGYWSFLRSNPRLARQGQDQVWGVSDNSCAKEMVRALLPYRFEDAYVSQSKLKSARDYSRVLMVA